MLNTPQQYYASHISGGVCCCSKFHPQLQDNSTSVSSTLLGLAIIRDCLLANAKLSARRVPVRHGWSIKWIFLSGIAHLTQKLLLTNGICPNSQGMLKHIWQDSSLVWSEDGQRWKGPCHQLESTPGSQSPPHFSPSSKDSTLPSSMEGDAAKWSCMDCQRKYVPWVSMQHNTGWLSI